VDKEYVVRGKKQGEDYISFTIYAASCIGCFSTQIISDMNDRQLIYETDGVSFEIFITNFSNKDLSTLKKKYKNILNLSSSKSNLIFPQLITRHYYERELSAQLNSSITQNLSIELVPNEDQKKKKKLLPYKRFTDSESAERLERVISFVTSHTILMPQDASKAPKWFSFTPNVFGPATLFKSENTGEMGAVDIVYSAAPFKFQDVENEGLLITGKMPQCSFANVVLWNVFLQSLSYERGNQVSLNRKQMKSLNSKGEYKILLTKNLPKNGLKHNIDYLFSEGRVDGSIFWRFLLVNEIVETPISKIVNINDEDF